MLIFVIKILYAIFASVMPAEAMAHQSYRRTYMERSFGSDHYPGATGYVYSSYDGGPSSVIPIDPSIIHTHFNDMPFIGSSLYETEYSPTSIYTSVVNPDYSYTNEFGNGYYYREPAPVYEDTYEHSALKPSYDGNSGVYDHTYQESSRNGDVMTYGYNHYDDGDFEDFYKGGVHLGDMSFDGDNVYRYGALPLFARGNYNLGLSDSRNEYIQHYLGDFGSYADKYSDYNGNGGTGDDYHSYYNKGDGGNYEKDFDEGYYDTSDGKNSNNFDMANLFDNYDSGEKSAKASNFKKSEEHDKGSETSGFHKVYHKDEFKKNHNFYDVADKKGSTVNHASYEKQDSSNQGGHNNAGNSESSHSDSAAGQKGIASKLNFENNESGNQNEDSGESHHVSANKHLSQGGHNQGNEFGLRRHHY